MQFTLLIHRFVLGYYQRKFVLRLFPAKITLNYTYYDSTRRSVHASQHDQYETS